TPQDPSPLTHHPPVSDAFDAEPGSTYTLQGTYGTAKHPQFLDHRPYRPRQDDPQRSAPRTYRYGELPRNGRAASRLDGSGAREGNHDQGARGPHDLPGVRWPGLRAESDRH